MSVWETGNVIGLPVTVGTPESVTEMVIDQPKAKQGGYVCLANVHMLVVARRYVEFRVVIDEASCVTSDGMPLVWALRHQGFVSAERVCGVDLVLCLCRAAEKLSLGVYFLGGNSSVLKQLTCELTDRFPKLIIAGSESPPMLPEKTEIDNDVVERIRISQARLVFVGLGCPKQEYWMAAYTPHLEQVLVGVGAVFDFLAGNKSQAPKWMQKVGLEWLFRITCEPRRLWRRYLVTNTLFIRYLMTDWLFKIIGVGRKEKS